MPKPRRRLPIVARRGAGRAVEKAKRAQDVAADFFGRAWEHGYERRDEPRIAFFPEQQNRIAAERRVIRGSIPLAAPRDFKNRGPRRRGPEPGQALQTPTR